MKRKLADFSRVSIGCIGSRVAGRDGRDGRDGRE